MCACVRACVRVCVCVCVCDRSVGWGRAFWLFLSVCVCDDLSVPHSLSIYPRCYSEYPYNLIFESRGVNYDKK